MPGLRLGYCLCGDSQLAEQLFPVDNLWGVSIPAQAAGIAALQETGYLERTRSMICRERQWLSQQLAARGLPGVSRGGQLSALSNERRIAVTAAYGAAGEYFSVPAAIIGGWTTVFIELQCAAVRKMGGCLPH